MICSSGNEANPASVLRITETIPLPATALTLTWPSVSNRYYTVERAFRAPANFTALAELPGRTFQTSYRDSWLTNPPPAFYRVRADIP